MWVKTKTEPMRLVNLALATQVQAEGTSVVAYMGDTAVRLARCRTETDATALLFLLQVSIHNGEPIVELPSPS